MQRKIVSYAWYQSYKSLYEMNPSKNEKYLIIINENTKGCTMRYYKMKQDTHKDQVCLPRCDPTGR